MASEHQPIIVQLDPAEPHDPHDTSPAEVEIMQPSQSVIVTSENSYNAAVSGGNIIVYTDVDSIPGDHIIYTTSSENVCTNSPNIITMDHMDAEQNHDIITTAAAQEVTHVGVIQSSQIQGVEMEVGQDGQACLVCGDRGSGYHYSVYSCEGCKGFFKRTVQKTLSYACKEDGRCNINKFTRNNCQYCRFQKCHEVGMKKEAVREDRTPGGKHRHKRLKMEGDDSSILGSLSFLDAEELGPDDQDMLQKLLDAKPTLKPSPDTISSVATDVTDSTQITINDLMQYGYMELRLIIEWARKVPGFSELLIEDQMALLKASFMELNVLRLAFRSMDLDGKVNFVDGCAMSVDQGKHIGWGKDLISCTLDFINCLKDINMDDTEFAILNAIVLTYPDASGIQDKPAVSELQATFLDGLRKYSSATYPQETYRYGRMLLKLPALRTVSAKAAERFLKMSLDGSIKMNALVWEMMS